MYMHGAPLSRVARPVAAEHHHHLHLGGVGARLESGGDRADARQASRRARAFCSGVKRWISSVSAEWARKKAETPENPM